MFGFKKNEESRGIGWLTASVKDLWLSINRHISHILKLESRTDAVEGLLIRQGKELERLRKDTNIYGSEIDRTRMKVLKHDKAAGGFWRTASGHLMRIRDMSTDHIKNCLKGGFAEGPLSRKLMNLELTRRKEDEAWHKKPMPGEEQKPEPKMGYVGRIYGTPVFIPEDTDFHAAVNVGNFLRRFNK